MPEEKTGDDKLLIKTSSQKPSILDKSSIPEPPNNIILDKTDNKKNSDKKLVKPDLKTLSGKNTIINNNNFLSEESIAQIKKLQNEYDEFMDNKIIKVKFKWGGTGYLTAGSIKRKLSMTIKTFFGRRENI